MSFQNHEPQGGGKFAYVSKGKIVTYENKNRIAYDSILGFVMGLNIDTRTYNQKDYEVVELYLKDKDNNERVLVIPLESGYGSAFCKMAKNIDWAQPLEISAKLEEKDGKKRAGLFIKQPDPNGKFVNVKWAYTEANPGKMPKGEEKTDRNGKYFDYSKRNEFFRKLLIDYVCKALKKQWPHFDLIKAKDAAKVSQIKAEDITEPIDDLPF